MRLLTTLIDIVNSHENFGEFLKAYRKSQKVSSKKLSTLVNHGVTYVSQIENQRILYPKYETALEILRVLGMNEKNAHNVLRTYNITDSKKPLGVYEKWIHESSTEIFDTMLAAGEIDEDRSNKKDLFNQLDNIIDLLKLFIQADPSRASKLLFQFERILTKQKEELTKQFANKMLSDPDVLELVMNGIKELLPEEINKQKE